MSRATLVAFAVGGLGLAALLMLGLSGWPIMPSYLGAWLFILALPLGALPVLMGCELLGVPETVLTLMLRRLAAVMPLAAVLSIPVLLRLHGLYPWLAAAKGGLPGWWMTSGFFVARAILFLAVWVALSLVFSRRSGGGRRDARRPLLAGLGLGAHLVIGTLAADDWAQAVEPSFNSSAFGLLFIASQCSIAVSLGTVMAVTSGRKPDIAHPLSAERRDLAAPRHAATALAVLLAAWGFLAFTQYLVVWSANLPREVIWYQHRAGGVGLAAEYSAGLVCALALLALLPRGFSRHAGLIAWVAATLLVMHGLEMLWLVTPAFRFAFRLTLPDVLALLGAAGLGIGMARLFGERWSEGKAGHGGA